MHITYLFLIKIKVLKNKKKKMKNEPTTVGIDKSCFHKKMYINVNYYNIKYKNEIHMIKYYNLTISSHRYIIILKIIKKNYNIIRRNMFLEKEPICKTKMFKIILLRLSIKFMKFAEN